MKSLWRGWHWYFSGPALFCFVFFNPKKVFSCYYTHCAAAVAGFPQDAWCSSGFSFPRSQVLISFSLSLPLSASVESPGRHGVAQSLHRWVEKVLHSVRHLAQAFLPAGNHSDGQTGQQQEVQCGGQHRPQGETEAEQEGGAWWPCSLLCWS